MLERNPQHKFLSGQLDQCLYSLPHSVLLYYKVFIYRKFPFKDCCNEQESQLFGMMVLDVFCISSHYLYIFILWWICIDQYHQTFNMKANDESPNVALVHKGCISSALLQPKIAFSIQTLSVYQQTHRVCPQLSIQAEVRKLCHLHSVHLLCNYNIPFMMYLYGDRYLFNDILLNNFQ